MQLYVGNVTVLPQAFPRIQHASGASTCGIHLGGYAHSCSEHIVTNGSHASPTALAC